MFCPNCGEETASGGQFCGSCGANLETGDLVYGDPLPRVRFVDAIKLGFSNYFRFSGRSRRSEYWFWQLFLFLAVIVFVTIDVLASSEGLGNIFILVTLIPGFSVAARRLHDIGKSGWWQLLWLVPLIGWAIVIIWYVRDGDEAPNKHGPNPKYGS